MLSSWQEPTKTRPSARAAKAATSMDTAGSPSRGLSSAATSSRRLPAYARPSPRMAPTLIVGLSCAAPEVQGSRAAAGRWHAPCMPHERLVRAGTMRACGSPRPAWPHCCAGPRRQLQDVQAARQGQSRSLWPGLQQGRRSVRAFSTYS